MKKGYPFNVKVALVLIVIVLFFVDVFLIGGDLMQQTSQSNLETDSPSSQTNSSSIITPVQSPYPKHKNTFATMFWVGEKATNENDYIPNMSSAWDQDWLASFGGVDNPYERKGFHPASFTPKENPFYVALPYDDLGPAGRRASSYQIPWYDPTIPETHSLLKNRWVQVTYNGTTCFGQVEDVGPFEEDDFEYVFGTAHPKSKRAGIDLSPAMRTCLKMVTNKNVSWQFVDAHQVPEGPWKEIITTSQNNWL